MDMLELKNVSAGYGGQDCLRGICLRFEKGRIYAVVGKNGSGKSTLLKTCAGILAAGEGRVLLDGRPIAEYEPRERARKISYLSQMRNLPGISAERMVEHGCYPRLGQPRRLNAGDRAAVQLAMERMDVLQLRRKSMKELSGGECQRVYMAMQLAQDAEILLLDEPTTYMDIEYQLELMKLMGQLRDEGKTVVIVLHDLPQALGCADEILAMDAGKIAAKAAPGEILASGTIERIFNVSIRDTGEGYVYATTHPK